MGVKDEEFMAKLLATFRLEAEEHIKALSDGVLVLEATTEPDQETVETIFREAHSLKGAARSVNQSAIQHICQMLENVLSAWRSGKLSPSTQLFDALHATIDTITQALNVSLEPQAINDAVDKLKSCLEAQPPKKEEVTSQPLEAVQPQVEKLIQDKQAAPKATATTKSDKTIRISLSKLDRLLQETEEMLMAKLVSQQESSDLKHLLAEFRSREKEVARLTTELQSTRQGQGSDRKTIKRVAEFLEGQQQSMKDFREALTHVMKSSEVNAHFIGTLVDTLLEDIKKVLMQPVEILFEAIPRMVRDISKEVGKQVHFESEGGDIEVDRRILEEIKDPILHLIRNAIDHGIESPEERVEKGKPREGTIRITASETSGGSVELCVSDDGKGFNVEKLKSVAINKSPLSAKDISEMSDEEAMKLAFHSGISTSPTVTDLSGRGLGLGIVSEKADKLGGRVIIESLPGEGTTFRILLPLTLATFRGIHLSVSGQDFIMPTHNVSRVLRIKRSDIKTIENREAIMVDDRPTSFVHLASLLNIQQTNAEKMSGDALIALIITSEQKTVAFGADVIHREHEVLVKSLGKQCIRVKNIMAATIMEWGNVIPILNPTDLVRSAVKGTGSLTRVISSQQQNAPKKRVLIAEDSITTRLLLKNILESAGYIVHAVSDGQDAYEALQKEPYDLLLTDVDMPRMDGFSLTEKVRASSALKDTPIIICTGKGSKEDRERGIELGADAYLDKSTFSQGTLLSAAQKLI
ncbi:MAG: response regulator [Chlamydiales bacterium]|nr:response regulator [Chlamydiales bacterium]